MTRINIDRFGGVSAFSYLSGRHYVIGGPAYRCGAFLDLASCYLSRRCYLLL